MIFEKLLKRALNCDEFFLVWQPQFELATGRMIDDKTAQLRRRELEEESSFFGSMDGASKFVRGDAIAGLIITAINIVGGIAIGYIRHGMRC